MAADRVPTLELDVQLATDSSALPAGADFATWIRAALKAAAEANASPAADGAISLRLVGLEEGAQLNSTWRQKPGPTNVLAFPGPRAPADLPAGLPASLPIEYGDLVICLPVVAREAAEQGKEAGRHLAHLVVHGTLHLLGYTHDEEAQAARMEALETRILAGLGIPDPYVIK
jgi:probable rRNA maturation factor